MAWKLPALLNSLVRRQASVQTHETLLSMDRGRWWYPMVMEPYTGAWQSNVVSTQDVTIFYAVYACMERIASDVGKCRLRLVEENDDKIWEEVEVAAFSPVIRKPNHYQNRIQFFETWILSKLMNGNTYILKERDARNVVIGMHILDPFRCKAWQTPDGDVYYELGSDYLSGMSVEKMVPASEVLHDMMTVRYHPLCGIPPMASAFSAAAQGRSIQNNSTQFFQNKSFPGGVLTAPGEIKEATAKRLKDYWQNEFRGDNMGKIAVLGDGLKFEPLMYKAQESQMYEQLTLTAQMVCSAFGVPPHMIGVGPSPSYNNIEALNQQYYSQTLQKYFEAIELLLDEGLGLVDVTSHVYGTWFDLDDLLRMDTHTMYQTEAEGVKGGFKAPNESRLRLNLPPVAGGDSPYLQQQNFSLEALAKRDAQDDPFAKGGGAKPFGASPASQPPPPAEEDSEKDKFVEDAATTQLAAWALQDEMKKAWNIAPSKL